MKNLRKSSLEYKLVKVAHFITDYAAVFIAGILIGCVAAAIYYTK